MNLIAAITWNPEVSVVGIIQTVVIIFSVISVIAIDRQRVKSLEEWKSSSDKKINKLDKNVTILTTLERVRSNVKFAEESSTA